MTQWHEFLASQGAVAQDGLIAHFGNPQAELQATASSNILADLSHLALLQLEGEDRVAFLQGQVTNDVNLLDGRHSQYAGYCNPKGRMLALFLAFSHHDQLHLQLPLELAEPILKRLKMYVLRSKVVITDVSDTIRCFGIAGPQASSILENIFGQAPAIAHELLTLDKGVLIRMPGPVSSPRYQVFVAADSAVGTWKALSSVATPIGKACWDWLEIQAGIPEVNLATQEEFVPQMINLDALDGINYKKGCYTGQEIVARTHYLGKVKRRTQLAHIAVAESSLPNAGDDVFAAGGGEPVGKIVRAAPSPEGGADVLAEVRLESLQSGRIQWQGKELEVKPLPYQLISQ